MIYKATGLCPVQILLGQTKIENQYVIPAWTSKLQ